jgi:plasmid stabilization system protein ParE
VPVSDSIPSPEELRAHFEEISATKESGRKYFEQAIPGFIEALGYDENQVFFDVSYEPKVVILIFGGSVRFSGRTLRHRFG